MKRRTQLGLVGGFFVLLLVGIVLAAVWFIPYFCWRLIGLEGRQAIGATIITIITWSVCYARASK